MKDELTATQQTALSRENNLAVTAGAGTGKTLVLVRRYLDILLKENVKIHNILAITFTNKAASEMIERVADELDQILNSEKSEAERSRVREIRSRLSTAYISTIHAFCTRLLREFPLHLGIDPDFIVLNDMQVEILLETAYKKEIESLESEAESWTDVFRLFGAGTIKKMLKKGAPFRYELQTVVSEYQDTDVHEMQKNYQKWFVAHITGHVTDTMRESLLTDARQICRDGFILARSDAVNRVYEVAFDFVQTGEKESFNFCIALTNLAQMFTKSDSTAYSNLSRLGGKNAWSDPDLLLRLSEKSAQIVPFLIKIPESRSADFARAMSQFYRLFTRFLQRYDDLKTEQGAVDFDDLQLLTLRLLAEPPIRNQIRRQFQYIMVDEFQDTNQLQWDIIRTIWEDSPNNLFVVGDPKQSIYGFRNADVRVFKKLQNEFMNKNAAAIIPLDESFRFKEKLTVFLNSTFTKILTDQDEWSVDYHNLKTSRNDSEGGHVEYALFMHDPDQEIQAHYICGKISELINGGECAFKDVAVLLRTRTHLSEIEEMFRNYQLPFQTVGGVGFYQRQEIYDIYHLIRFLINPYDDIALVGLIRSPFVHISDEALFFLAVHRSTSTYWERIQDTQNIESLPESDRTKLERFRDLAQHWQTRRDRVGFYELLEEMFYQSNYAAIMAGTWQGDRLLANIRKIADLAIEYEASGFLSLTDFAGFLNTLINREAQEGEADLEMLQNDAVTIMTIHQSKGLQFPVVFVPHLEQKIRKGGEDGVYIDTNYGIAVKTRSREDYFLLDFLKKRKFNKDLAELKGVLYVACTRARDRLYLSGTVKEKTLPADTPLAWIVDALGIELDTIEKEPVINNVKIHTSPPPLKKSYGESAKKRIKRLKDVYDLVENNPASGTIPLGMMRFNDKPKFESFSATQIMMYARDKDDYYRRYYLGYFEGDYDRLLLDPGNADMSLLKGKIIHRYLEAYPDFDLQRALLEFEVADVRLRNELENELTTMADRVKNSSVLNELLSPRVYKNEVTVHMKLGNNFITGTLDKIYKTEGNIWEVVDYKSNHISQREVEQTTEGYIIQLETYALLLAHLYPGQDIYKINLYYLFPDVRDTRKYLPADISTLREKFSRKIDEMRKMHSVK